MLLVFVAAGGGGGGGGAVITSGFLALRLKLFAVASGPLQLPELAFRDHALQNNTRIGLKLQGSRQEKGGSGSYLEVHW